MSETMDKLGELKKLNAKFYELFGELFESREIIPNKAIYEYLTAKLFEQYKAEYEVLKVKTETEEKPALYNAKLRHSQLVPRRRFFLFRNRAQKLIDEEVTTELEQLFREYKSKIEMLIDALDSADDASQRPTAFDVTEHGQEKKEQSENTANTVELATNEKSELEEGDKPGDTNDIEGAEPDEERAAGDDDKV